MLCVNIADDPVDAIHPSRNILEIMRRSLFNTISTGGEGSDQIFTVTTKLLDRSPDMLQFLEFVRSKTGFQRADLVSKMIDRRPNAFNTTIQIRN